MLEEGSAFAIADFASYRQPDARIVFVTRSPRFFRMDRCSPISRTRQPYLQEQTPPHRFGGHRRPITGEQVSELQPVHPLRIRRAIQGYSIRDPVVRNRAIGQSEVPVWLIIALSAKKGAPGSIKTLSSRRSRAARFLACRCRREPASRKLDPPSPPPATQSRDHGLRMRLRHDAPPCA